MQQADVIILAGGYGKRMQSDLPKALVELDGKPLIEYVLQSVKVSGVTTTPVVVVGQKRELVIEALGTRARCVVQEEQLGTGHAVQSAIHALNDSAHSVLVLYVDHPYVSSETIKNLIKTREERNATVAIATVQLPHFLDWYHVFKSFGRIIRDTRGMVTAIVEAKDASEDQKNITEVNPAYFCFEKKWLVEALPKLKNDNAQGEYYLTDLVALAMKENKSIASVSIEPKEALGTNSKEDIALVESLN